MYIQQAAKDLIAIELAINAIGDCSVVGGFPLEEYLELKREIEKL
jgi:hypothetical protein